MSGKQLFGVKFTIGFPELRMPLVRNLTQSMILWHNTKLVSSVEFRVISN